MDINTLTVKDLFKIALLFLLIVTTLIYENVLFIVVGLATALFLVGLFAYKDDMIQTEIVSLRTVLLLLITVAIKNKYNFDYIILSISFFSFGFDLLSFEKKQLEIKEDDLYIDSFLHHLYFDINNGLNPEFVDKTLIDAMNKELTPLMKDIENYNITLEADALKNIEDKINEGEVEESFYELYDYLLFSTNKINYFISLGEIDNAKKEFQYFIANKSYLYNAIDVIKTSYKKEEETDKIKEIEMMKEDIKQVIENLENKF